MIVFRLVRVSLPASVSVCRRGQPADPERPTMTPVFVRLVEPGDGEDGVPMPGRRGRPIGRLPER